MEYNSERSQLVIPEYGRHVHEMVAHVLTIQDREQRNQQAQLIIDVIGNLNPHLRDTPDFKHKLWDHLFIMSDFKLDVDSPYPIPDPSSFETKPELLPYPKKSNKFRHYGTVIRRMIDEAGAMEPGELRDGLILALANQMKRHYLNWNKDTVEDAMIIKELRELSNGAIRLDENVALDWAAPTTPSGASAGIGGKLQKNKNFKNKKNNRNKRFVKKTGN